MAIIGAYYGPTAGSGRFRVGAEVQYIATDPSKGYHIQYRYYIDVLKTAVSVTYFTENMRVSWASTLYKCGNKIERVGTSSWIEGGWVQYPNTFTIPDCYCAYYYSSGEYRSTMSGKTVAMPGPLTYTVTFNANGGSGAPAAVTGNVGSNVTIPTTKPTRTGYTFKGWSKTSTGTAQYQPGGTINAAATLYAVWQVITYTVSYNANGGTGAPGNQTKTYGQVLRLSVSTPRRDNHDFLGWATSATGAVVYQPGGEYKNNAAVTLYAIWKQRANGYMKFDSGWEPGMVYVKTADGWKLIEAYEKTGTGWTKSSV